MIELKDMPEFELTHLIKKGGMLIFKPSGERYLVIKTRKRNHMLQRKLTIYSLKTQEVALADCSTDKIWRYRNKWAYIPPTKKKR
tara:strand:+ start:64 stop:318 length:255 start_codon:yes stop_codon:yes gene_type:complete